jgi:hypothetical protein
MIARGLSSRSSRLPAPPPPGAGVILTAIMSTTTDSNQAELLCRFSNKCPFPIIISFLDHEEVLPARIRHICW